MLVLTRKPGDAFRIGPDITVTILGTKGNQVRIGIAAPRSVNVVRTELDTPAPGAEGKDHAA